MCLLCSSKPRIICKQYSLTHSARSYNTMMWRYALFKVLQASILALKFSENMAPATHANFNMTRTRSYKTFLV